MMEDLSGSIVSNIIKYGSSWQTNLLTFFVPIYNGKIPGAIHTAVLPRVCRSQIDLVVVVFHVQI